MFIKEISKKNKSSDKVFTYHRLIDSYRTEAGPRQRVVLNLGKLTIDPSEWKALADCIEDYLHSRKPLFPVPERIQKLAKHYAGLIAAAQLPAPENKPPEQDFQTVDLRSVETSEVRNIGGEYIAHSFYKKIQLPQILTECGLTKEQADIAEILIVSRLIQPGSERHTLDWVKNISGLAELLERNLKDLPLINLYRAMDRIYANKETIEKGLRTRQKNIFNLDEKIILYDLTNTYFEGNKYASSKIAFGRSKEKRSDAKLITLGLLVDGDGFVKSSNFFEGNVSEPGTLAKAIETLSSDNKPTVIMDAGIATSDNIALLKDKGFNYICVSRNRPDDEHADEALVEIRSDGENRVEGRLIRENVEVFLFCKSLKMGEKESAMLKKFRDKYEAGLKEIQAAILKKGGTKSYDKVMERIGRLKERSHGIHRAYRIDVTKDDKELVTDLQYAYEEKEYITRRYEGSYYIRSSRTDLSEKELWELYITLTGIEDTFRTLKDELNMRPVFHRKESRIEAHLFIAILAYHVLNAVRHQLRAKGYLMKWSTLRERMATQVVSTLKMKAQNGKTIYLRHASEAELRHREIYDALGMSHSPIPPRKTTL